MPLTLPTFLVAGAPRCGTTALVDRLRYHPEVFIPDRKELGFFTQAAGDLDWYASHFPSEPPKAVGEGSPHYMASAAAARRIRNTIPQVKLIFLVRNPVQRAISHHWTRVTSGRETRSLAEVVDDDSGCIEDSYILKHGLYAANIRSYLELFDPSQILTVFTDDLGLGSVWVSVVGHVGVDAGCAVPVRRSNSSNQPRSYALNVALAKLAKSQGPTKRLARSIFSSQMRRHIRHRVLKANSKPLTAPVEVATDGDRRALLDFYENDIADLEVLTRRDLSHWDSCS
jgi:hypothetical protein